MSDTGDDLTIAAAAAALSREGDKISRQGLSKYCDTYELKISTPRGPRVSLAAVRAHRQTNYQREVMSGTPLDTAAPADLPPQAVPANDAPPSSPAQSSGRPAADVISLDPSRRLKELQVEEAEIKNAQLRGEIVQIDEVSAGIAEAIVLLRQSGFQSVNDVSQALAAELSLGGEDERIIRAAIKQYFRDALTRFIAEAGSMLAALAGEKSDAVGERINALIALSETLRKGAANDAGDIAKAGAGA